MQDMLAAPATTFGTGHSLITDPAAAARAAVRGALGGRSPAEGDLVFVFPTIGYDPHAFLEAAQHEAGPAHVVGCSAFASAAPGQVVTDGCVATYVPAAGCSFGVASVERLGNDLFAAARTAAEQALERAGEAHPHSALLVLSDGLAGDQREIVRGTYAATGAMVPLVGGAAGDDLSLRQTYQFADGRVMTNGIVAVWINSPQPIGVGVAHGWRPVGRPLMVTRVEGNLVHEIDGRPAVDAYLAEVGHEMLDNEAFAAKVMNHPLGLVTESGRYEIRHIMDRTDDGGLVMFGYVGEGAVVRAMDSDCNRLLTAASDAASDALELLEDAPRGALVFSCAARAPTLGDRLAHEMSMVSDRLGGCPAGGFFTYGEFARVTGSTGFHNATVAVLAL